MRSPHVVCWQCNLTKRREPAKLLASARIPIDEGRGVFGQEILNGTEIG